MVRGVAILAAKMPNSAICPICINQMRQRRGARVATGLVHKRRPIRVGRDADKPNIRPSNITLNRRAKLTCSVTTLPAVRVRPGGYLFTTHMVHIYSLDMLNTSRLQTRGAQSDA